MGNTTEVADLDGGDSIVDGGDSIINGEGSIVGGGDSICEEGSIIDGGDSIVDGGDSIIDGAGVNLLEDCSIEGDMTSIASLASTSQADSSAIHTENNNNNNNNNHNRLKNADDNLPSGLKGKQQYAGWSPQDHEVFAKIFRRALTSGMLRKPLLEALRTQLPHLKGI